MTKTNMMVPANPDSTAIRSPVCNRSEHARDVTFAHGEPTAIKGKRTDYSAHGMFIFRTEI